MQITLEDLIKHVKEAHVSAYGLGYRDGYVAGKATAAGTNVPQNNDQKSALDFHIESIKELYDK